MTEAEQLAFWRGVCASAASIADDVAAEWRREIATRSFANYVDRHIKDAWRLRAMIAEEQAANLRRWASEDWRPLPAPPRGGA